MKKLFVCAVILGIFVCEAARCSSLDCVHFLRSGDERICMKPFKETSPSIAALVDGNVYYASLTTENRGRIKISYEGTVYSAYNRDDDYELIHWLSGTDALVDGVWRDKVAIDGAMDFINQGCAWNAAHDGYYSADGLAEYFATATTPTLDFGSDWYMEITAQVGNPIGNVCFLVDLASLRAVSDGMCGTGFDLKRKDGEITFTQNTKPWGNTWYGSYGNITYTWGNKATFVFGSSAYGDNQSRSFVRLDGVKYEGTPYDVAQWNRWDAPFFLFRGFSDVWYSNDCGDDARCIGQCGPTTIYDIKVWRRK